MATQILAVVCAWCNRVVIKGPAGAGVHGHDLPVMCRLHAHASDKQLRGSVKPGGAPAARRLLWQRPLVTRFAEPEKGKSVKQGLPLNSPDERAHCRLIVQITDYRRCQARSAARSRCPTR